MQHTGTSLLGRMEARLISCTVALFLTSLLSNNAIADCSSDQRSQDGLGVEQHCHNTWFYWNETTHKCVCGPDIFGVSCSPATKQVRLRSILTMTYDNLTNSLQVGIFPFKVPVGLGKYSILPENLTELNNAMCGNVDRDGLLCSKCKPGYGPAALSYEHMCARCSDGSYGWLLYILLGCIPPLVFFSVIILCQIRVTSASLNIYVMVSQLCAIQVTMHFQRSSPQYYVYASGIRITLGIVATFITSWNLEFFRLLLPPFCISESISNLQVLCLEYIVAFIPLILTAIMYVCIQQHARGNRILICLWKPFELCFAPLLEKYSWNPMESIVHAFASFLVLSSTKILYVSYSLLFYDTFAIFNITNGNQSFSNRMLYYDPTLTFFGKSHLPYALLAIAVSTIFVIIPTLVLILYPTRLFHKCLNCCGIQWLAVHAFADAFNGCYRNGADGKCDCRCFAGFYLLLRILYIVITTLPLTTVSQLYLYKFILISSLLLFALVSPYKNRIYNICDSSCLAFAAYYYAVNVHDTYAIATLLANVCSIYMLLYPWVIICLKVILKTNTRCSRWLKAITAKMTAEYRDIDVERSDCNEENDLPDRLVNSGSYRMLTGGNSCGELNSINDSNVPTYGIA